MSRPHCDDLVLHTPGECKFCDLHSDEQNERIKNKISFTGKYTSGWESCPSEVRRKLTVINKWPGNRPSPLKKSGIVYDI